MLQFQECIQQYEYAMIITEEVQILVKIPGNILMKEDARSLPFLFSCQHHCPPLAGSCHSCYCKCFTYSSQMNHFEMPVGNTKVKPLKVNLGTLVLVCRRNATFFLTEVDSNP